MSNTIEHLDIEFEKLNSLGVVEIVMLKGEKGEPADPTPAEIQQALTAYISAHPELLTALQFTDANNDGNIVITLGGN